MPSKKKTKRSKNGVWQISFLIWKYIYILSDKFSSWPTLLWQPKNVVRFRLLILGDISDRVYVQLKAHVVGMPEAVWSSSDSSQGMTAPCPTTFNPIQFLLCFSFAWALVPFPHGENHLLCFHRKYEFSPNTTILNHEKTSYSIDRMIVL